MRSVNYRGSLTFGDWQVSDDYQTVIVHEGPPTPWDEIQVTITPAIAGKDLDQVGKGLAEQNAKFGTSERVTGDWDLWLFPIVDFTLTYLVVPAEGSHE